MGKQRVRTATEVVDAKTPKAPAVEKPHRIKVRALQVGYYGEKLRRIGDVFYLNDHRQLASTPWMESADRNTPLKETSHGEVLRNHHDEIARAKQGGGELVDEDNPTGGEDVLGLD